MEEFGLGWALGGISLTALVTTLGTWIVTSYSLRREAETQAATRQQELIRHARYLAIRVVCVLDPFINECVDVVHDMGIRGPDGETEPRIPMPTLAFPDDVDWRSIEPDLMYRILGFPNEIAIADQAIGWIASEIAGSPDYEEYFWERTVRYGGLGLTAVRLADDLRRVYGIKALDRDDWNPIHVLQEQIDQAEKQRADSNAMQSELSRKMMEQHQAAKAAEAIVIDPIPNEP